MIVWLLKVTTCVQATGPPVSEQLRTQREQPRRKHSSKVYISLRHEA